MFAGGIILRDSASPPANIGGTKIENLLFPAQNNIVYDYFEKNYLNKVVDYKPPQNS